jgi:hypothetical protein
MLSTYVYRGSINPSLLTCYQFELPAALMKQEALVGWCTLFINVVNRDVPSDSLPEDLDERELNHWWKAKKWAYANMNRLFVRLVL